MVSRTNPACFAKNEDELTDEDRAAIQAGLASLEKSGGIPMDDVLADLGLTMAEFEKMTAAPGSGANPLR
jgi:hypothetical protein